jgi:hypothetical protein
MHYPCGARPTSTTGATTVPAEVAEQTSAIRMTPIKERDCHPRGVTEPTAPAAKSKLWGLFAILGLVALCGLSILIKTINGDGDVPDGNDAQVACKHFVEQRLKAPSTAGFSGLSHSGSDTRWTVTGVVDAENSFGAKLRMDWTCQVHLVDGDWLLDSLTGLS